jgi:uncharacterized coiled-coil DUF342 family protein
MDFATIKQITDADELEEAKDQIKAMTCQIASLNKMNDDMTKQIGSLNEKNDAMAKQIASMNEKNEAMASLIASLITNLRPMP